MKRHFKVKTAEFSEDGKYRYVLTRIWNDTRPFAMCIGLNPSRADAEKDDTTISLLVNCLDALGFGGLKMVNVFAYITPHPKELDVVDPFVGNEHWIVTTAYTCQAVIFCWGNFKQVIGFDEALMEKFPDALCFGINLNGSPWHPRAMTYAGITASEARLEKYKTGEKWRIETQKII